MSFSAYRCGNNACEYYVKSLKKGKRGESARWIILRAHLERGSYVKKTYCPVCHWELRIGIDADNKPESIDKKELSAVDLIRRIQNSARH